MQRLTFGRGIAALFTMTLLATSGQTAMAMPKEQGTYDCSCKGGSGSCTFKSSSTEVSCYHGAADTCAGNCELTSSPNPTGGIAKGSVKAGPVGNGGAAAR